MRTFAPETKAKGVPVLVDVKNLPADLPKELGALKPPHHAIVTSEGLADADGDDYQDILVACWQVMVDSNAGEKLIIGEHVAEADLKHFVETLTAATGGSARQLSRIGAGVLVVTPEFLDGEGKNWADVIVLTDTDTPNRRFSALLGALSRHPKIKTVAVVGTLNAGLGAAFVAGVTLGQSNVSSGTAISTHANSTSFLTTSTGSTAKGVAGMGAGGKAAVAFAGLLAVGGIAAVAVPDDHGIDFDSSTTLIVDEEDSRFYPLGEPGEAKVLLGPPKETSEVGSWGEGVSYVSRTVILDLPGEPNVDIGTSILPTSLGDDVTEGLDDGLVPLDGIQTVLPAGSLEGEGASEFCFMVDEPSTVVAGWKYSGAPLEARVLFSAIVEDGKVNETSIQVEVSGQAERTFTGDAEDANLSDCPATDTAVSIWRSTSS